MFVTQGDLQMPYVAATFFPFLGRKLFTNWFLIFFFISYYVPPLSMLLQWGWGERLPYLSVGVKLREVWRGWTAQDEAVQLLPLKLHRSHIPERIKNFCNRPRNVLANVAETVPWIRWYKYTGTEGYIHLNGKACDLAISFYNYLSKDFLAEIVKNCVSAGYSNWLWLRQKRMQTQSYTPKATGT